MRLNYRQLGMACSRGRITVAMALLLMLGLVALRLGSGAARLGNEPSRLQTSTAQNPISAHEAPNVLTAYGHLPLIFERNQGQSDARVKFLARGGGYSLFLTADEAVLALRQSALSTRHSANSVSVLRMGLANASRQPDIVGDNELPGKSNYFIGNDPAKWHRDVSQFARVRYRNVYPGIDLVYHGNQGRLEYDFEVAPGGDPQQVALRFLGTDSLTVDSDGNLVLGLKHGRMRFQSPRVYQELGDQERAVPGRFELRGSHEVGFALGAYDRSRALIIDPILTYSTYFGGSGDEACSVILGTPVSGCPAVTVDTALNAYIAGITSSADFPLAGTPYQSTLRGAANIFVAKFNGAANTLIFSTYLGGDGTDYTAGVTVDPGFNVFVAGTTNSTNFPTSSSAFQTAALNTNNHVFVSQLDPAGHTLLYSTYLSGDGTDTASGIALGPDGNAYVTGTTTSTEVETGFPSTLGAYQTSPRAANQFFLTKLNPTLSGVDSVPYSTYFGGSTPSTGQTVGGGIAVDNNSNAYITGGTDFTNLPVLNAFQGASNGGLDAFVAKISPGAVTGTQLIYSTYIGGSGDDIGHGIAVDTSSNVYVTGSTISTNFPAAGTGVFQSNSGGGTDAFLAKFGTPCTGTGCTNTNVPLNYSTYLGGSGDDVGLAIALDNTGSPTNNNQGARITGWTSSTDFPSVNNPVQSGFGGVPGVTDAFVARIDTTATTQTAPGHYSTYLGGSGDDYGTSIASDTQGASYVAGETTSSDLLTKAPPQTYSYQQSLNGSSDAFLSKLGPVLSFGLTASASPSPVGVGSQVTFTYTITNTGDFTSGITFTDTLQNSSAATFVSATTNTGTNACGQPNGGTVLCNIGTLNAGATATVTVILTPVAPTPPATNSVTLGNSGFVGVSGSSLASAAASVTVNDFDIGVAPATATVAAGVPATYTATVTPTGSIPASVSFSCSSGLPTGAACTETTNPIPNLENGAADTVLIINTTARVTTTTEWWHGGRPFYAGWLPISGLALLGAGIGKASRKRRVLMGLLLAGFFALIFFQPGCSSSKSTTTTTGTPAGTYIVTVSATSGGSGAAVRSTTVTLVVE
ncbi:MAG: SBBP repeat-containing protein [Acidobacteriia bacterium]|nr:SBBP repeat-containing protein [Terriglobia bacterium]